jgi:hypothetical protein
LCLTSGLGSNANLDSNSDLNSKYGEQAALSSMVPHVGLLSKMR